MGGIGLLLWYGLLLAVQFGPLGWLLWRWDRQDRASLETAIAAGDGRPRLPVRDLAIRIALGLLALAIVLPVTLPMQRASASLAIALGQG